MITHKHTRLFHNILITKIYKTCDYLQINTLPDKTSHMHIHKRAAVLTVFKICIYRSLLPVGECTTLSHISAF